MSNTVRMYVESAVMPTWVSYRTTFLKKERRRPVGYAPVFHYFCMMTFPMRGMFGKTIQVSVIKSIRIMRRVILLSVVMCVAVSEKDAERAKEAADNNIIGSIKEMLSGIDLEGIGAAES